MTERNSGILPNKAKEVLQAFREIPENVFIAVGAVLLIGLAKLAQREREKADRKYQKQVKFNPPLTNGHLPLR